MGLISCDHWLSSISNSYVQDSNSWQLDGRRKSDLCAKCTSLGLKILNRKWILPFRERWTRSVSASGSFRRSRWPTRCRRRRCRCGGQEFRSPRPGCCSPASRVSTFFKKLVSLFATSPHQGYIVCLLTRKLSQASKSNCCFPAGGLLAENARSCTVAVWVGVGFLSCSPCLTAVSSSGTPNGGRGLTKKANKRCLTEFTGHPA